MFNCIEKIRKEDIMEFDICEKNIGYTFKNRGLLKEALTHTSYAYENKVKSNERL